MEHLDNRREAVCDSFHTHASCGLGIEQLVASFLLPACVLILATDLLLFALSALWLAPGFRSLATSLSVSQLGQITLVLLVLLLDWILTHEAPRSEDKGTSHGIAR